MTPAGLLASGSVRCAPAPKDDPGTTRRTTASVSNDQTTRMEAILEERLESPAANSTNERVSSAEPQPGRGHASSSVVPIVFVVGLLLLSTSFDGAFALRSWAPPAIFVLVLLAVTMFAGGGARIADRRLLVTLGAGWALALWALLSMTWANSPADAWEGASRMIFYAGLLTLPALVLPGQRVLALAGAGVVVGISVIGAITLFKMLTSGG